MDGRTSNATEQVALVASIPEDAEQSVTNNAPVVDSSERVAGGKEVENSRESIDATPLAQPPDALDAASETANPTGTPEVSERQDASNKEGVPAVDPVPEERKEGKIQHEIISERPRQDDVAAEQAPINVTEQDATIAAPTESTEDGEVAETGEIAADKTSSSIVAQGMEPPQISAEPQAAHTEKASEPSLDELRQRVKLAFEAKKQAKGKPVEDVAASSSQEQAKSSEEKADAVRNENTDTATEAPTGEKQTNGAASSSSSSDEGSDSDDSSDSDSSDSSESSSDSDSDDSELSFLKEKAYVNRMINGTGGDDGALDDDEDDDDEDGGGKGASGGGSGEPKTKNEISWMEAIRAQASRKDMATEAKGKDQKGAQNATSIPDLALPALPFTQVPPEQIGHLKYLGKVHSIVDGSVLVVEQDMTGGEAHGAPPASANLHPQQQTHTSHALRQQEAYSVLDTGSLLCAEDGKVLGSVFETFGSVQQPYYSLLLPQIPSSSSSETGEERSKPVTGAKVYYLSDHSTYVLTKALKTLPKGSDASNVWDEEVGDDEREFSDDEEEARFKRERKSGKQGAAPDGGQAGAAKAGKGKRKARDNAGNAGAPPAQKRSRPGQSGPALWEAGAQSVPARRAPLPYDDAPDPTEPYPSIPTGATDEYTPYARPSGGVANPARGTGRGAGTTYHPSYRPPPQHVPHPGVGAANPASAGAYNPYVPYGAAASQFPSQAAPYPAQAPHSWSSAPFQQQYSAAAAAALAMQQRYMASMAAYNTNFYAQQQQQQCQGQQGAYPPSNGAGPPHAPGNHQSK